jgi:hypothetical protein
MNELIAAVLAAKDKDELEKLVRDELGIELDKRRGLETLRKDILAGLGVGPDGQPLEGGGAKQEQGQDGEQEELEEQEQQEQQEQGGNTSEPLQQPTDLDGQGEIAPKEPVAQQAIDELTPPVEPALGGELPPADPLALAGLELPELENEERELEEPAPANRLLRNRENGREFVWTPELAQLAHMEEV